MVGGEQEYNVGTSTLTPPPLKHAELPAMLLRLMPTSFGKLC